MYNRVILQYDDILMDQFSLQILVLKGKGKGKGKNSLESY